jgi:hypothetical protein
MNLSSAILKFATSPTTVAGSFTQELSFRRGNADWVVFFTSDASASYSAVWLNTSTGALGSVVNVGTFSGATATVVTQDNSYFRLRLTFTKPLTGASDTFGVAVVNGNGSFVSTIGQTTIIWGADLRVANDTALPVYQRVNTATDYDATGFPTYLRFDGVDDSMATASINFTATAQMTTFVGVRKLNDTTGVIQEFGIAGGASAVAGTNYIIPVQSSNNYEIALKGALSGTLNTRLSASTFTPPITNVLSVLFDISQATRETEILPRVNGSIPTLTGSGELNAGTGNFGNHSLYIGARAGTSVYFNGRIYSLIVRGAATSETQIGQTEQWISNEMGGGYVP